MPGADPGEGYMSTSDRLYGSDSGPTSASEAAPCLPALTARDGAAPGFGDVLTLTASVTC